MSVRNENDGAVKSVVYTTYRYHTDPEFKMLCNKRTAECVRRKRDEDPEYDAMLRAKWREYSKKYAEDPEKREKRLEYKRLYNARKRAEKRAAAEAAKLLEQTHL